MDFEGGGCVKIENGPCDGVQKVDRDLQNCAPEVVGGPAVLVVGEADSGLGQTVELTQFDAVARESPAISCTGPQADAALDRGDRIGGVETKVLVPQLGQVIEVALLTQILARADAQPVEVLGPRRARALPVLFEQLVPARGTGVVRAPGAVVLVQPAQVRGLAQVLQDVLAVGGGQRGFLDQVMVAHGTHRTARVVAALPAAGQEERPWVPRRRGCRVDYGSAAPDLAGATLEPAAGQKGVSLSGMAVVLVLFHAVGVADLAKARVVVILGALADRQVLANIRTFGG
mmetsp:Transcript_67152/g.112409  ORF Transcript_67152/g.112409 Transcript_67152/m.112409 type:complete len:288 (-) Transcript_67152:611-1474(-)